MSKWAIIFVAALFTVSTGYDSYRGYYETRSIGGAIAFVIFGMIILAFLWWLKSKGKNSG